MNQFELLDDVNEMVPDDPDGYDLTFAEGTEVDEALLRKFKAKAHELGIPRGKTQKLADFWADHTGENSRSYDAALLKTKKGWEAAIMARPGFSKELGAAQQVLKNYGDAELPELLRRSLLGSNPSFFDFMVKVAGAIKSSGHARPSSSTDRRGVPLAERLWPDQPAARSGKGGRSSADRMWPDM